MTTNTAVELAFKLYHDIKSFKKIYTKADIFALYLNQISTDNAVIQQTLTDLQNNNDELEIQALKSMISLREYLTPFADTQSFYRKTLSVNSRVDVKMIRLSKSHPVSLFKSVPSVSQQICLVYITPYNEIELLEMALNVLKDQAASN